MLNIEDGSYSGYQVSTCEKVFAEVNVLTCGSVFSDPNLMKIILKEDTGDNPSIETAIETAESSKDQVGSYSHREEAFAKQKQEPKTFYASKQLLQKWSKYFAALSNFQEGQEDSVTITGIHPRAFGEILHWIYTGHLTNNLESGSWEPLVELYAAVDVLNMPVLTNVLVGETRNYARSIGEITLTMLYQLQAAGVPETTRLAQFVMDCIAYNAAAQGFANIKADDHAQDFFTEGGTMVAALMDKITSAMSKCNIIITQGSWENLDLIDPVFEANHRYHELEDTFANGLTNIRR